MSGGFTVEDNLGEIIYASSPGMDTIEDVKNSSKKPKSAIKKYDKRSLIDIFDDLYNNESDPVWVERFEKMSTYKFPSKISWVPSRDMSDIYGNLVYKNRKNVVSLPIARNISLEDLAEEIKSFVNNYTSIDMEAEDQEMDRRDGLVLGPEPEDDIKICDKTELTPMPWVKLSSKDHKDLLTEYIKSFSKDNDIEKKESSNLLKNIILFAMGRNIFPYLVFDESGHIKSINSLIYRDSDGKFKLNIPL